MIIIRIIAAVLAILGVILFVQANRKATGYIAFCKVAEAKSCHVWSGIAMAITVISTIIALG